MKQIVFMALLILGMGLVPAGAGEATDPAPYTIGIGDVLDVAVLQPETLTAAVTVAPDGTINFPYIGQTKAEGLTLSQIQEDIQNRLADGYMRYPVVSVALKESNSRKFFVYGEVVRPGTYPVDEKTTVLRAISMAGGMTKFGSSSRVKLLRPQKDSAGYETVKVNLNEIMNGSTQEDVPVQPGDIVVVSEGAF